MIVHQPNYLSLNIREFRRSTVQISWEIYIDLAINAILNCLVLRRTIKEMEWNEIRANVKSNHADRGHHDCSVEYLALDL